MPTRSQIGSVVIEGKLATSAAGDVYLGRQPGLDRRVVIHKLRRDLHGNPAVADRFRRQARYGAAVSHPAIEQVHDLFDVDGDHYLIVEYVDGCSLADALAAAGRAPRAVTAYVALELAGALAALHARGVVHAGISPARVRLSRWGEIKLSGFHASRSREEESPPPLDPSPYVAPELFQGEPVRPSADVFALGVMLQEMLEGEAIAGVVPVSLRSRLVWGSGIRSLESVASACRRERREQRPQMREVRTALERLALRPGAHAREAVAAWLRECGSLEPRGEAPPAHVARPGKRRGGGIAELRVPPRVALPAGIAAGVALLVLALLPGSPEPEAPRAPTPTPSVSSRGPAIKTPASTAALLPPGRVTIVAYPWAEVRVADNRPFFTPRATPISLAPGSYEVVFSHPSLGEARRLLDVEPGQERVLRHVFDGARSLR